MRNLSDLTKLVHGYINDPSAENFKKINDDLVINLVFAVVNNRVQNKTTPAEFRKIFNLDFYGYETIYRDALDEKLKWFAVISMWDTCYTNEQSHHMWQVSLQQMRAENCYGDDEKKYQAHLKFLEKRDDWYEECGAIDDEQEFDLLERSWRGTPREIAEIEKMPATCNSFETWVELFAPTKMEKRIALFKKIKELFFYNYA